MYVRDYMSDELITVRRDTSLVECQDLIRRHHINRLPVVDDNMQLVGLVTRDLIDKNLPSQSASYDRYELNYLLDQLKASDIMIQDVQTTRPDSLLDQAAKKMSEHFIGSLVVVDQGQSVGIITYKDILRAFVDISGLESAGTSLVVELHQDRIGIVEEVGDALTKTQSNLTHMLVYHSEESIRVVLRVQTTDAAPLVSYLEQAGYQVTIVNSHD